MAGADDFTCPEHGWRSHVLFHEAGHAVAAVDLGVPFVAMEIPAMSDWEIDEQNLGVLAGGVRFAVPPSQLVGSDPEAALAVLAAGVVVEDGAFGHHLENSFVGDLRIWAQGASAMGLDAETVGRRFHDAMTARREWVVQAFPRIRSVVVALSGQDPDGLVIVDDAGPWRLSYDEVLDVLRN